MASIKKYGEKWRVQINERGVRRSRTFKTKAEATQWVKYFENTFFSYIPNSAQVSFHGMLEELMKTACRIIE